VQISESFVNLFGVSVELLDDGGLARFHLRQFFSLIVRQRDGVFARIIIEL